MAEAAAAFAAHLEQVPFAEATVPVLSNTDPTPTTAAAVLRRRLLDQMTTGVRWRETMDQLQAAGVTAAVEIGPGTVLSGLIRRACPGITTAQIATAADLDT
jgi:[acyl-carrier-protein] S-malonyltransferase